MKWVKDWHDRIRSRSEDKGRGLNRMLGIVSPGSEFYQELETIRSAARARFWAGVFLAGISAYVSLFLKAEHPVLRSLAGVIFGVLGAMYVVAGRHALREAYRAFCMHHILPYQRRLRAEYPELGISIPRFWVFRSRPDLRELEQQFIAARKRSIERIERRRKEGRWRVRNEKLRAEMLDFIRESALSPETKRMSEEKAAEIWELLPLNPERRKEYVARIRRLVAQLAYQARQPQSSPAPALPAPAQAEEAAADDRLHFLESAVRECKTAKAVGLRDRALKEADRRTRIRLLKQALHEERSAEEAAEEPAKERIEAAPQNGEARFIVLDQVMEERFQIAELVPEGVDALMAKEILLELLDPGSGQRRFQNAYRPEPRLRRRVRQRFSAWCDVEFDPCAFDETLKWLVRVGVLRTKPKKEPVFSLSANIMEATSDQARALIGAVIKLDRELKAL